VSLCIAFDGAHRSRRSCADVGSVNLKETQWDQLGVAVQSEIERGFNYQRSFVAKNAPQDDRSIVWGAD